MSKHRRPRCAKTSKGQLSEWLRGIHSPLGGANHFDPRHTPMLAHVTGVQLGDGSITQRGYNKLSAIDLELVMEFDRCLSSVLDTRRHKPLFDKRDGTFAVEGRSVLPYEFLRKGWRALKPWIEHWLIAEPDLLGGSLIQAVVFRRKARSHASIRTSEVNETPDEAYASNRGYRASSGCSRRLSHDSRAPMPGNQTATRSMSERRP